MRGREAEIRRIRAWLPARPGQPCYPIPRFAQGLRPVALRPPAFAGVAFFQDRTVLERCLSDEGYPKNPSAVAPMKFSPGRLERIRLRLAWKG